MKNNKKCIIEGRALVVSVIILLSVMAFAQSYTPTGFMLYPQTAGSANYNTELLSISSLGKASSATYRVEMIAYDIIGTMSSTNYQACLGWYCSYNRPYNMHLVGMLIYSGGGDVTNTPLLVTVYNTTIGAEYSARGITNSLGKFDISVNVPDELVNKGFAARITVYGDVEAVLNKKCLKASEDTIICSD